MDDETDFGVYHALDEDGHLSATGQDLVLLAGDDGSLVEQAEPDINDGTLDLSSVLELDI